MRTCRSEAASAPSRILHGVLVAALLAVVRPQPAPAQQPSGLAASALAEPSLEWIRRQVPGFRVYFAEGSWALAHADSLLARLPAALSHARALIDAAPPDGPIHVFFVQDRARMKALTGRAATGFAEPSTRTVLLVTNRGWRAFERHEVMHVVARETWGEPAAGTEWLQEGLAQAADGRCAGRANLEVARALAARHGWVPLDELLLRFRAQPDLRAYLQAAAFVDHVLGRYGPEVIERFWVESADPASEIEGRPLREIERDWRTGLAPGGIDEAELSEIEVRGCG